MDENTKAKVANNTGNRLTYQQNGKEYCSYHFDFTPLIKAYQRFLNDYSAWRDDDNYDATDAAWLDIGKAQRNVPAHVAQEYCRPDRSFWPTPEFNEARLPRSLSFFNLLNRREESFFPLTSSNSGLGFNFGIVRPIPSLWSWDGLHARTVVLGVDGGAHEVARQLEAIIRLDEVRTAELKELRKNLNPRAEPHLLSRFGLWINKRPPRQNHCLEKEQLDKNI